MKVVCDFCHALHSEHESWWVDRLRQWHFYNPEKQTVRNDVADPERLWFCKKSHRDHYMFGA